MGREMKKIAKLCLMWALAALLILPACVWAEEGATAPLRIGITVYDLNNPYFATLLSGARERAAELGIELIENDPASDVQTQLKALYNFIAMDVDAIIVCGLDVEACEEPLRQARERGIKIVSQSSKSNTRDIWVSADEWDMGYECGVGCGKWLLERYGADAEPCVLVANWDVIHTQIARGDGMEAGIREYAPNAVIIRRNANTIYQGINVMEAVLKEYPDVTAVTCINDATAIGVYSVIQEKGYDSDDFYIGSIDATEDAIKIIRTGCAYRATVDLMPFDNGKLDVSLAIQLINGERVPETYVIPAKLITQEDLK